MINNFRGVFNIMAQGRLMYTTGETEKAMRYFLGLLKGSNHSVPSTEGQIAEVDLRAQEDVNLDKIYLEDFRVAFQVCYNRWSYFRDIDTHASGSILLPSMTINMSSATSNCLSRSPDRVNVEFAFGTSDSHPTFLRGRSVKRRGEPFGVRKANIHLKLQAMRLWKVCVKFLSISALCASTISRLLLGRCCPFQSSRSRCHVIERHIRSRVH